MAVTLKCCVNACLGQDTVGLENRLFFVCVSRCVAAFVRRGCCILPLPPALSSLGDKGGLGSGCLVSV